MTSESSIPDTLQSKVSFQIKKFGFLSIKGSIEDFQGDIFFDENDLANSYFNVSVSTKTINTGNAKRDEHLKNQDFFHVKEFPKIHFQSNSIKKYNNQYLAVGQLTLLKETKEISIPFTYQSGVCKGSFSLNRQDYNLGIKFPTFVVGNTIQININSKIK